MATRHRHQMRNACPGKGISQAVTRKVGAVAAQDSGQQRAIGALLRHKALKHGPPNGQDEGVSSALPILPIMHDRNRRALPLHEARACPIRIAQLRAPPYGRKCVSPLHQPIPCEPYACNRNTLLIRFGCASIAPIIPARIADNDKLVPAHGPGESVERIAHLLAP